MIYLSIHNYELHITSYNYLIGNNSRSILQIEEKIQTFLKILLFCFCFVFFFWGGGGVMVQKILHKVWGL